MIELESRHTYANHRPLELRLCRIIAGAILHRLESSAAPTSEALEQEVNRARAVLARLREFEALTLFDDIASKSDEDRVWLDKQFGSLLARCRIAVRWTPAHVWPILMAMPRELVCRNRKNDEDTHDLFVDGEAAGIVHKAVLKSDTRVTTDTGPEWLLRRSAEGGPLELVTRDAGDETRIGTATKTRRFRQFWALEVGSESWSMRPARGNLGRNFALYRRDSETRVAVVQPVAEGFLRFFVGGWRVLAQDDKELSYETMLLAGLLYHVILDDRRAPGMV